ncbi:unnamed protein product [Lactuca saligna]|uniref:Uncharacterized protein n=1 Tax=Lactuca saligna TaxID=75948 RepID=A0AA35YD91_LACSI|nr:unnamed protein product [Lactuca saligna]
MVTKLAKSFGIFNSPEARFFTKNKGRPIQTHLFKTTKILVDLGNDTYSISDDTLIKELGRRNVRPRKDGQKPPTGAQTQPQNFGFEIPMDPYNVILRQYQDYLGRYLNFVGYSLETIMNNMELGPPAGAPTHFTYIPIWEEHSGEERR